MSKIEVDAIEPQSGTTLTLGASGDTISVPSGATISGFTTTDDIAIRGGSDRRITLGSTGTIDANNSNHIRAENTVLKFNSAGGEYIFEQNGTERMRIDSSGHTIIPAGVTLGTAVGTYSASNTLDDYEEGTFIPTIAPSTSGTITINNSQNELKYTKIGHTVFIQGRLSVTSSSSPSGVALNLGNLPFTPEAYSEGSGWFGGMCAISFDGSSTFSPFTITKYDLATLAKITCSSVSSINSNTRLQFNFFYYTSS